MKSVKPAVPAIVFRPLTDMKFAGLNKGWRNIGEDKRPMKIAITDKKFVERISDILVDEYSPACMKMVADKDYQIIDDRFTRLNRLFWDDVVRPIFEACPFSDGKYYRMGFLEYANEEELSVVEVNQATTKIQKATAKLKVSDEDFFTATIENASSNHIKTYKVSYDVDPDTIRRMKAPVVKEFRTEFEAAREYFQISHDIYYRCNDLHIGADLGFEYLPWVNLDLTSRLIEDEKLPAEGPRGGKPKMVGRIRLWTEIC